ncbi:hypothetical protein [Ferruginibacter sp.]|jgi:chloride channel protein, CIC family
MSRLDESTPFSPTLYQLFGKMEASRKAPVNKRVFYLSIQAIINAVVIGFIAKLLVALIGLITNIAF